MRPPSFGNRPSSTYKAPYEYLYEAPYEVSCQPSITPSISTMSTFLRLLGLLL